ncbi:MAG: RimK-like ATPgrasp N-terminal domain-containing protein [Candidatus Bathyarchaeota archaeon]|nr:RimK-like ATPgrasp N-terminal domain-containing protein [Candidatus Bathyarchaeota archaeon]
MLVVSNLDLTIDSSVVKPSTFLGSTIKEATLNINNEYRYLKTGYYVSLHAEVLGNKVIPSCENIIDSSRTPVLLLRAARAGIPTLPFLVTDSVKKIATEMGFPAVLFAVNPFIYEGFKTAHNKSALYRAMKSLGMNYKFAVCAQPLKGEMVTFKSFFGKCESQDIASQNISRKLYEAFNIPVCKLHIQKTPDEAFLCGLEPINKQELTDQDLKTISKEVMLFSEQGDTLVVQNRLFC